MKRKSHYTERKQLFTRMVVIFVGAVFIISGCKTTRSIYKEPIKEEGAGYLLEQLEENMVHFNTLSAKFTVDYFQNKKKTSFKGQFRIIRDSAIWVSISPLMGIEAARMLITPDSVKVLNRMDNTYYFTTFNSFRNNFNEALDFDMFQAFVLGNDFTFYDRHEFKASIDGGEYRLVTSNRQKLKNLVKETDIQTIIPIHHIWLNPESFKITRMVIKEVVVDSRKIDARYSDFITFENNILPTKLVFDIESDENKIEMLLEYSKVTFDEPLKLLFKIPSKYTEAVREN